MLQHFGIYVNNLFNKTELLDRLMQGQFMPEKLNFGHKKIELFSSLRINKIIEDEERHGFSELTTKGEKGLAKMSSGEQKKVLLHYLLHKKCGIIILDDAFGNLDKNSHESLKQQMCGLEEKIIFIQIFHQKSDLLPFIEMVLMAENKCFTEVSKADFLSQKIPDFTFNRNLPESINPDTILDNPLISMQDLCVNYEGRPILNKINWQINKGEFWQLVGPNGSGKSTIITMLTGDNPKAFGQNLLLFGNKKGSGENVWDIKKHIGYFTPSMTLRFTRLDSIEKMIMGGFFDSVGQYSKPTELQKSLAEDWLKFLGMYDIRNHAFDFLSLGQQRMVMVARAMVKYPPLLILDEPTTGLDEQNLVLFTNLINNIAHQTNIAIIYVSHRTESGLKPDFIYELRSSDVGSSGSVVAMY